MFAEHVGNLCIEINLAIILLYIQLNIAVVFHTMHLLIVTIQGVVLKICNVSHHWQ